VYDVYVCCAECCSHYHRVFVRVFVTQSFCYTKAVTKYTGVPLHTLHGCSSSRLPCPSDSHLRFFFFDPRPWPPAKKNA
jgi:hypothetical protein